MSDVSDVQKRVVDLLRGLSVGSEVVLPGRGGWEMVVRVTNAGGEFDFAHRNPVPGDGRFRYFVYTTEGNPYGAGKIDQDPSLRVPCRSCGVDIDGGVVGALVFDAAGQIVDRFSWSNEVFSRHHEFSISEQGELVVDGQSRGFLRAVFLPDKNRMQGYVGVFGPTKPEQVRVLEMEDLLFASLDA